MAFRVRTLVEVLDGMLSSVIANSEITDINRGSIVRTLLEAAALQDADQYLQIARLKDAFSIETATGSDLDDRGADFGISRLSPTQSTGTVTFADSNFTLKVSNTLNALAPIGSGTVTLADATSFPASGSVIFERDTVGQRELVAYTSKAGNVLTLASPTTLAHAAGTSVILSTVGSDRVFSSNLVVSVPATPSSQQLDFRTQAAATLLDGDVETAPVAVLSSLTGALLNVGTGQVSLISSPPFPSATVTNAAPMQGGRDEETDDEYRQRIKQTIQALSNGTINDLVVAASGVTLASGQRVIYVQVVEEFTDPDVSVYIDDGTGSVTTTEDVTSTELLIFPAEAGQRRCTLGNWPIVSGTLSLQKSSARGTIDSVVPGVGTAQCFDPGAAFVPGALVGLTVIDSNRITFTITANGANDFTVTTTGTDPVPGDYAIFSGAFLVQGTDYLFNETTGDIELVAGLAAGDVLAAVPNPAIAYSYYTGLIQEVQKVLNGDPNDLDSYPGVKATGVKVKVRAPTVSYYTFNITVLSSFGTVEATLVTSVKDAVLNYVNGLGVGGDIVLAEIVAAVMAVPGIIDCRVNSPTSNVPVLDGVLPRTKASLITVL